MPEVTITVPDEYDKKVNILKAERGIGSKARMIEEIIKEYFSMKEKLT